LNAERSTLNFSAVVVAVDLVWKEKENGKRRCSDIATGTAGDRFYFVAPQKLKAIRYIRKARTGFYEAKRVKSS
jgi:hypothetical protein